MSIYIESYHHRRDIYFNGDDPSPKKGGLYLGVEVECDCEDDTYWNSDELETSLCDLSFFPLFDPTGDGSLTNGVEFVSYPQELDKWMEIKDSHIAPSFRAILNSGLRSHNTTTCGLHVHASKAFFRGTPELVVEGMSNLLILMEQNWNAFSAFARRSSNRFSSRLFDRWTQGHRDVVKKGELTNHFKAGDRYKALNISGPNTVEFRIFKGTLNVDTFYATLQLVSNMMHLAKASTKEEILEMDFMDIVRFEEYPELAAYVRRLDLYVNKETVPEPEGDE